MFSFISEHVAQLYTEDFHCGKFGKEEICEVSSHIYNMVAQCFSPFEIKAVREMAEASSKHML
jgi:hypothetical protein